MQNSFIARLLAKPAEAARPEPNGKPLRLEPADENTEMHDSTLFDVVVEVDFYDGRRIWIPQQSTPAGWSSPF